MPQISTNKLNLWKFVKFVGEKNKKFRERYLFYETSITNMRLLFYLWREVVDNVPQMPQISTNKLNLWKFVKFVGEKK